MSSDAPTGTVTLVFTDIEGSSALWDRLGDGFRSVLAVHDPILREAIAEFDGYEVQTAGDAFMVAFQDATNAARYCLAVQQRLQDASWPQALGELQDLPAYVGRDDAMGIRGVRVRMGMHTGEPWIRADPTTGRMDYGGPMCNTAARVGAAAHGGQIIVTERCWSDVEPALRDTTDVTDLGSHSLRGIEGTIGVWQLLPRRLHGRRFPRIKTLDVRKTNLPTGMDSFIGRSTELGQIRELFDIDGRQVSIVGGAGSGKTRLAQRYGALFLDDYSGGVWFCDLVHAHTITDIAQAVASSLGIALTQKDPLAQLVHAISSRGRVLIILDTFEQIRELAEQVLANWLLLAPGARVLVTSRTRLGVRGEHLVALGPLSTPEAIQLFEDRARSVRPDFAVNEGNRGEVTEIVERLDCMSLAVELAAARIGVLSPAKLLGRLSQRFKLLRGRGRDKHARQATLRGAIDWSWDLLDPWEKYALAQCSVFRGGFTLEAAEAVIDLECWPDAPWAMDVVQSLMDKSLLRIHEPLPGQDRFVHYRSVHAYASEKLAMVHAVDAPDGSSLTGAGAARATAARHASHFAGQVSHERLLEMDRRSGSDDLERLALDQKNLEAAIDGAGDAGESTIAVRCGRAVLHLLYRTGPFARAQDLYERIGPADDAPPGERARLLQEYAGILRLTGRFEEARTLMERALAIATETQDIELIGNAYGSLGFVLMSAGQREAAALATDRAIELCRSVGNRRGEGQYLSNRAIIHYQLGEVERAVELFPVVLEIAEQLDLWRLEGLALGNLSVLRNSEGKSEEALELAQAALALHQEMGDRRRQGMNHSSIAAIQKDLGRTEDSRNSIILGLELCRAVGDRRFEGIALGSLGELLHDIGEVEEARIRLEEAIAISDAAYPVAAGAFRGRLASVLAEQGQLDEALKLLDVGEAQLRGTFILELGKLLCRRGGVAIRAGSLEDAREALAEAVSIARQVNAGPRSELAVLIDGLRRSYHDAEDIARKRGVPVVPGVQ